MFAKIKLNISSSLFLYATIINWGFVKYRNIILYPPEATSNCNFSSKSHPHQHEIKTRIRVIDSKYQAYTFLPEIQHHRKYPPLQYKPRGRNTNATLSNSISDGAYLIRTTEPFGKCSMHPRTWWLYDFQGTNREGQKLLQTSLYEGQIKYLKGLID